MIRWRMLLCTHHFCDYAIYFYDRKLQKSQKWETNGRTQLNANLIASTDSRIACTTPIPRRSFRRSFRSSSGSDYRLYCGSLLTFGIPEELWWRPGRHFRATIGSGIASRSASLPSGCSSGRRSAPDNRRTRCARSPDGPASIQIHHQSAPSDQCLAPIPGAVTS